MKNLIYAAIAFLSLSAAASTHAQFSAFTHKNILYFSFLYDTCNAAGVQLRLADDCGDKGECTATVSIIGTQMACGPAVEGRIQEIDLKQAGVPVKAKVLTLIHFDQQIDVQINR